MSYSPTLMHPTLMQWMEADPTGAQYIDGLNLRQMEDSNPINRIDPTGLATQTDANWTDHMSGLVPEQGEHKDWFDKRFPNMMAAMKLSFSLRVNFVAPRYAREHFAESVPGPGKRRYLTLPADTFGSILIGLSKGSIGGYEDKFGDAPQSDFEKFGVLGSYRFAVHDVKITYFRNEKADPDCSHEAYDVAWNTHLIVMDDLGVTLPPGEPAKNFAKELLQASVVTDFHGFIRGEWEISGTSKIIVDLHDNPEVMKKYNSLR